MISFTKRRGDGRGFQDSASSSAQADDPVIAKFAEDGIARLLRG
jgi:hypothetical protein